MWYERGWRWAKEHLTITVPGVVLIFAATYIVVLAVNAGEVGAAWVQAVGSVAAILAAIWIANRQHLEIKAAKHEQDKIVIALILEIASRVRTGGGGLIHSLSEDHSRRDQSILDWLVYLERERTFLRSIDLVRLPSVRIAKYVLLLISNIEITDRNVRFSLGRTSSFPKLCHEIRVAAETFEAIERDLKAEGSC